MFIRSNTFLKEYLDPVHLSTPVDSFDPFERDSLGIAESSSQATRLPCMELRNDHSFLPSINLPPISACLLGLGN